MHDLSSTDSPPPVKPPLCPACQKAMQLQRAVPDANYKNLHHMMFKCDCGWESDQLLADLE